MNRTLSVMSAMFRLREIALVAVALVAGSCASTQPPSAFPEPNVQRIATPVVSDRHLCTKQARAVVFERAGIPSTEYPVDVALGKGAAWVLLAPHRLLRVERLGEQVQVQTWLGPQEEEWTALDVDPLDESVWVATSGYQLLRVAKDGRQTKIQPGGVTGEGSFSRLLVSHVIHGVPVMAQDLVWRFDRQGKFIGADFPTSRLAEMPPDAQMLTPSIASFLLERDRNGEILAWKPIENEVYVSRAAGFEKSDTDVFTGLPLGAMSSLVGVKLEGGGESWFQPGTRGGLFFWRDEAVFLGNLAAGSRSFGHDTVLLVKRGSGFATVMEDCFGQPLVAVRTDAAGYVALTQRALVFGEFSESTPRMLPPD